MNNNRKSSKKGRKGPRRTIQPTNALGLPNSRRMKMRYSEHLSTSVSATNNIAYTFQTSAYDPYYAVGGHQPYLFDQMAALYGNYRVHGIQYKVRASPAANVASYPTLTLYVYTSPISAATAVAQTAAERPGSKSSLLSYDEQTKPISGSLSVSKLYGLPKSAITTDSAFSAAVTTNPVNVYYLIVQVFNTTAVAASFLLQVDLVFDVEFFNPAWNAGS